jgi:hypothetical protein
MDNSGNGYHGARNQTLLRLPRSTATIHYYTYLLRFHRPNRFPIGQLIVVFPVGRARCEVCRRLEPESTRRIVPTSCCADFNNVENASFPIFTTGKSISRCSLGTPSSTVSRYATNNIVSGARHLLVSGTRCNMGRIALRLVYCGRRE